MNFLSHLLTAEEWSALRLSFQVATVAATASLPFAVLVSYLLARLHFAGKWLVEVGIDLPLVLPPVVTGYFLLVGFGPDGPIGSILSRWLGIKIFLTWLGAALASAMVSFPLMVRAIRLAFEGVDARYAMAARSLAQGGWRPFLPYRCPWPDAV